jgi:hypothetical protein
VSLKVTWQIHVSGGQGSNYKGGMLFLPGLKAFPIGTMDLFKLRQGFEVFIANVYSDVPPVL